MGCPSSPSFPSPSPPHLPGLPTRPWLPAGPDSNLGDPFPEPCTQHGLCLAGGITVEGV